MVRRLARPDTGFRSKFDISLNHTEAQARERLAHNGHLLGF